MKEISMRDEYFSSYEIGTVGDNGEKISHIISKNENFVIYYVDSGKPCFDCIQPIMDENKQAIEKYDELIRIVMYSIPEKHREFLFPQLAYTLANYFNSGNQARGHKYFEKVEKCIRDIVNDYFQYFYVLASTSLFLLSFLILCISEYFSFRIHGLFPYAFMGSLGAFVSVISRSRKLESMGFVSVRYSIIQGLIRNILGSIFGVLVFFLIQSDLILGFFAQNQYHMYVIAVVAGLNERFVPEALRYAQ